MCGPLIIEKVIDRFCVVVRLTLTIFQRQRYPQQPNIFLDQIELDEGQLLFLMARPELVSSLIKRRKIPAAAKPALTLSEIANLLLA